MSIYLDCLYITHYLDYVITRLGNMDRRLSYFATRVLFEGFIVCLLISGVEVEVVTWSNYMLSWFLCWVAWISFGRLSNAILDNRKVLRIDCFYLINGLDYAVTQSNYICKRLLCFASYILSKRLHIVPLYRPCNSWRFYLIGLCA